MEWLQVFEALQHISALIGVVTMQGANHLFVGTLVEHGAQKLHGAGACCLARLRKTYL
jgi:hypothetical protein